MYQFENIPAEMKQIRAWVVWRYENRGGAKPTKVPYNPMTGAKASVTAPATWASFDECANTYLEWCNAEEAYRLDGIGFVLSADDEYCIIDLDEPKPDDSVTVDHLLHIINTFGSYAEVSPSGKGVHIITKASTMKGRRKGPIEVYSQARFMTMTGNVMDGYHRPIFQSQDKVDELMSLLSNGGQDLSYAEIHDGPQTISDEDLIERAGSASNGHQFNELFYTKIAMEAQGESEGDQALMNFIAAYTDNREQAKRIFMKSGRASRPKVFGRPDYLELTLTRAFDLKPPPVDVKQIEKEIEEAVNIAKNVKMPPKPKAIEYDEPVEEEMAIRPPPGLVGELAQFIYSAVPRPIAPLALAASLGLMAGIAGRAYNVSGTGLNQYLLALAPTGVGKEGIHLGIDKIMNAVIKLNPSAASFIGPGEIASPQALYKYLNDPLQRSFVSTIGEFGLAMKQMCDPRAPAHQVGLRRMLLDLFNKSGQGASLKKSVFADREKNTESILSPAVSLLGESTPERFYQYLDEMMVAEGLVPRFTIIEYLGDSPETNQNHMNVLPDDDLIRKVSGLCAQASLLNGSNKAIDVTYEPEAHAFLDTFERKCRNIQKGARELVRQIWSRAHMKALKLAALVAVECHPYSPSISLEAAQWACSIVEVDCAKLLKRFDTGDVGSNNEESKQRAKIIDVFRDFYTWPKERLMQYQVKEVAIDAKTVPLAFIDKRLANLAVFKDSKVGSAKAIKNALQSMMDCGMLMQADAKNYPEVVKRRGLFYVLLDAEILFKK